MNVPRSGECSTCSKLWSRLVVLCSAADGDRINTKTWELQPNTWVTSFSRTWSGMSRADTVTAFQVLHDECLQYFNDSLRNVWNKRLVTFHVRESIPWMCVIRNTYKNTPTHDELDGIIQQFSKFIDDKWNVTELSGCALGNMQLWQTAQTFRMFYVIFNGVSTGFWLRPFEKSFENTFSKCLRGLPKSSFGNSRRQLGSFFSTISISNISTKVSKWICGWNFCRNVRNVHKAWATCSSFWCNVVIVPRQLDNR